MNTHRLFALSPLALALGTLLSSTNALADDQSTPSNDIEEIVVTGSYVKSLEKAIDLKRVNIGFSDSIVASDIADFPEQNLAEALQRMPGVTIERNKGLGQKVNVRSLPSEFTFVSINNLATASGSGGRDVEFDMFASEIIQSVTVKKSPTAADEEGGIAGSVTITTARPFDYDGRQLVVSAETAYNDISEKSDPKFAVLASDTFGDWGALASFAYSKRSNRTDSNSGINFRPLSRWLEKTGKSQWQADQAADVLLRDTGISINDRKNKDETSRVVFLDKVGDRAYLTEQDKWGATLSLQYKPNSELSLTFDGLLGNFDNHEDEYDAAAYTASSISSLEKINQYDSTTLSDYGITVLTDVDYAATQHEFLSKENSQETDYQQFSLTLDWQLEAWKIYGIVGYSGAEKQAETTNLKHTAYRPTRTRYTSTGGETLPSSNPNTFDMYNSPDAYLFDYYEVNQEHINDDKYAAQLDFKRDLQLDFFPALAQIQLGVRATDKSKERDYGTNRVKGPSEDDSSWVGVRTLADSQLTDISTLVSGGEYLSEVDSKVNWMQIANSYARNELRYAGFNVAYEPDQYYKVKEKTLALYAMVDFHFDIATMPATLNAGVRYIDTKVHSSGYHQVQNEDGTTGFTAKPVSKDGNYKETLPSVNFALELTDDLLLRAAASKTFIRPALTDIAYKRSVSLNEFKYRDGNPDLKPTYADQWEFGLEWYLDEGALLAVSYFEKEIEGVVRESLTGVVNNVTKYNDNGSVDGIYDFDIYQKVNAEGSYDVSGIELVAQLPLSYFDEMLSGFGINANYTVLDNSLTGASDLGIPTPPEGLAEETYNVTVYYENQRFDARISYNYKDKYVERIERDMYPVYRNAYGQTDISLGYRVNDMVKVTLEGINILNEETTGYTLNPVFPTMYEFSGRRISLGIRGNF
ncbi:TonB-dependent receptor [Pseudoalteromonas xiamenensis]|uniref:TonB-dependent receptor n=1 Tax=Pseudoalteromonas xiamenensis TaxID=882626 RepID=UPI0027E50029|nr:TonB-dependent receptor [Pseudoalteromonas xiamenensis]WMN61248.1 TonB-dependent receptor [Pseudoalteromonas xiamenensis]